jgi:hypothetical protein
MDVSSMALVIYKASQNKLRKPPTSLTGGQILHCNFTTFQLNSAVVVGSCINIRPSFNPRPDDKLGDENY